MTVTTRRDSGEVTAALSGWLQRVTDDVDAGVWDVELPAEGAASESLIVRATWHGDGGAHDQRLVLRVQPPRPLLFPRTDVLAEADIMKAVAQAGLAPTPRILWTETDAAVLGTPFIAMEFVEGRLPPGVPSYHGVGWVTELEPAERARLHEHALAALAGVHATPADGLELVTVTPGSGDPLGAYLGHIEEFQRFAAAGRELGLVEEGLAALLGDRPSSASPPVLLWGDSRPGNMIFGPEQDVRAVIDWDMASYGPPEIDVGWWLMFEDWLTTGFGVERLEGVPDRAETLASYERLTGRRIENADYWQLLGAVRFALITTRYVAIQVELGRLSPETEMHLRNPLTQMIARALGRPVPELAPEFGAVSAASVKSHN